MKILPAEPDLTRTAIALLLLATTCRLAAAARDPATESKGKARGVTPAAAAAQTDQNSPAKPGDASEKSAGGEPTGALDREAGELEEPAIDHQHRALDGMQTARKRLADDDTGAETQNTQERVIKDLEELLAQVKRRRNPQNAPQNGASRQNQDRPQAGGRSRSPAQPDPQNSGAADAGGRAQRDQEGRRNAGKSADSQERHDAAQIPAVEKARRIQIIKDVWGHLPPHVREAMLNSVNEKYLPKYEDLVKEYYEGLADKDRKKSGQ